MLRRSTLKGYGDSVHHPDFQGRRTFVVYTRELDLSSCGGTRQKALQNLKEAVRLFLEEAENMGTPQQILEEAGI